MRSFLDFQQLFKKDEIFHIGNQKPVLHLTNNSKNVKENSLFFAIKGTSTDGHLYVEDAIKKGAISLAVEDKNLAEKIKNRYPNVNIALVKNTRKSQAEVAREFYDYPDKKLKIIGITGTNGKTTTSHLIAQFLEFSGKKVGIIGTVGHKIGDKKISEGMTTPDSLGWFYLLNEFVKNKAEYVVAEVSSHALDQFRVYGTQFYGAIFTNLSQDHLDYHKTMEKYFLAKKKLFDMNSKIAAINVDDSYGKKLTKLIPQEKLIKYGRSKDSGFRILDYSISLKGTEFSFIYRGKNGKIKTPLLGYFNIYNLSAAISFLLKDGFEFEFLIEKSEHLKPVKGRFEVIEGKDFIVVNDYAHTPDALEKILISLNEIKENRIITVFGAGGNRDREKRPLMGKIASELSDVVIITSDNPRSENPIKIIEDIEKGITGKAIVEKIPDREKAIKKAISIAENGDIVLIAGKGHEAYQIIGNKTILFDDTEIAKKYIKKRQQMLPRQEG